MPDQYAARRFNDITCYCCYYVNRYPTPPPPAFLREQDVMVVGEPSLMGGEFGDEDERLITRLENTQYDASAAQAPPGGNNGALGGPVGMGDPDNPEPDFTGWNSNPDRASAGPGGPTDEKKSPPQNS